MGLMLGVELVTDRKSKTPAKEETAHVMDQMKGLYSLSLSLSLSLSPSQLSQIRDAEYFDNPFFSISLSSFQGWAS